MRLVLTTCLVLVFFAANSVLARAALLDGGMSPGAFTAIRLVSGAAMLAIIVAVQGLAPWRAGSVGGALGLYAYAAAFSFAYVAMQAGPGALVLFGAVQITMFAGAVLHGTRPPARRWIGSVLSLLGLAILTLPGTTAPPLWAALAMGVAGIAWGVYSLIGARAASPLAATAGNFLWAAPLGLATWFFLPGEGLVWQGVVLAMASGAITSGLGYALWYAVLPRLDASTAALSQLTVPLIALAGGLVFLRELPTTHFALAAFLILGGVAYGLAPRKKLP